MNPTTPKIPRKWSWHHAALTRLRDTLVAGSAERSTASRTAAERGGADLIDVANVESEHAALLAQLAQEQTELSEVEAALARIANGTYGNCELTGEPIAPERLRAIPWTRWCRRAAEERERLAVER